MAVKIKQATMDVSPAGTHYTNSNLISLTGSGAGGV